jgi:hypothetical protein
LTGLATDLRAPLEISRAPHLPWGRAELPRQRPPAPARATHPIGLDASA